MASTDDAAMAEYAAFVDRFSIHDGLIVASHRAQGTEAIITADSVIRDADIETVWA